MVNSIPGLYAINSGGFGPGVVQNFVTQTNPPVNSTAVTAKPGQAIIVWATGLGPGLNPDNQPPQPGDVSTPVEVFVGGKLAVKLYSGRAPCCAGLDQIVFQVPADAPAGCYVPVQVRTAGSNMSNTVTMAIDDGGQPCSDRLKPQLQPYLKGGKSARCWRTASPR